MKKFLAFALTLALIGCDDNPVRTVEVDKPNTVYDTTIVRKTVILAKGAVYDTIRTKFQNNTIVGSLISNGTASVVCSENMNRCARTNSKGIYQISLPTVPLVAGRVYKNVDTVTTPETTNLSLGDTTITPLGNDTNIVSDTNVSKSVNVVGNDTIVLVNVEQIDTIYSADSIKVEISEPTPVAVKDTLSVVSGGTVLREIPINSWGHILDSGFVDKWSIEVYDTTYDRSLKNIEFVYFVTGDSIAQVVTLGREKDANGFTNRFSGPFFYYWDDSAYSKDKFVHNYFIRGKDSAGNVICKTDVRTFSAKAIPEKTVYLGKKIGLPQYMIQPKFVPAAKNNKKLKDAAVEYIATEDTTQSWIDEKYFVNPIIVGESNDVWYFTPTAVYDSMTVEILTEDSVIGIWQGNGKIVNGFNSNGDWTFIKLPVFNMTVYINTQNKMNIKYRNLKLHIRKEN
jgi:hypothetical protein